MPFVAPNRGSIPREWRGGEWQRAPHLGRQGNARCAGSEDRLEPHHERAESIFADDRGIERRLANERPRPEEVGRVEAQRDAVADVHPSRFEERVLSDLRRDEGLAKIVLDVAGFSSPLGTPVVQRDGSVSARYLSVREYAGALGVSTATVYEAVARGEIAHVRVSSVIRILVDAPRP